MKTIRDILSATKKSGGEWARELGISTAAVSQWNARGIPFEHWGIVAKAAKISIGDLAEIQHSFLIGKRRLLKNGKKIL